MDHDQFRSDDFIIILVLENVALSERFRQVRNQNLIKMFLILCSLLFFEEFLFLGLEVVSIDFTDHHNPFIKNTLIFGCFELRVAFTNNRNKQVKHHNLQK